MREVDRGVLRYRLMASEVRLRVGKAVWIVPPGERLLDVADDHPELGLEVSCRSAHCGTCLVRLCGSPAGAAPPGPAERETLAELGREDCRLGCQLVLTGEADVELQLMASEAPSD